MPSTTTSEVLCELCGESFPHPVTYHMRKTHAGCGQHAGGRGYNSGGNYCLGWAGNCGDGGVCECCKKSWKNFVLYSLILAGSSWYLLCENCRDKYVKSSRSGKQQSGHGRTSTRRRKSGFVRPLISPANNTSLDIHLIMKNNAVFLLELASSADTGICA